MFPLFRKDLYKFWSHETCRMAWDLISSSISLLLPRAANFSSRFLFDSEYLQETKGNLDMLSLWRDFALGIGEEFVRLNCLILPNPTKQNLILLQVHLTQSCHKCIKRRTKFRSLYLKNKHLQHASCRLQSERCSYYLKPPKDDELHSFRTNYASSSK